MIDRLDAMSIDVSASSREAPSRWVRAAAHAAVLTTLPAGLWRIATALGVPVGYGPEVLREVYDVPGWGSATIIGISVVQEALALLTLGLVRSWGEVVPRRLPLFGGRRVPAMAVVVPAAAGALVLTVVGVGQLLLWGGADHGQLSDTGRTVMGFCYLPMVLWGPLLGVATASYYRRHVRASRFEPNLVSR